MRMIWWTYLQWCRLGGQRRYQKHQIALDAEVCEHVALFYGHVSSERVCDVLDADRGQIRWGGCSQTLSEGRAVQETDLAGANRTAGSGRRDGATGGGGAGRKRRALDVTAGSLLVVGIWNKTAKVWYFYIYIFHSKKQIWLAKHYEMFSEGGDTWSSKSTCNVTGTTFFNSEQALPA